MLLERAVGRIAERHGGRPQPLALEAALRQERDRAGDSLLAKLARVLESDGHAIEYVEAGLDVLAAIQSSPAVANGD